MPLLFSRNLCIVLVIAVFLEKPCWTGRARRQLAFRKGSSFFYRVNYKVNLIPSTTIFAQAAGFKVAWELPAGRYGSQRLGRSIADVQESIELVYERHGFDGKACLLKSICQILQHLSRKDSAMAKIVKLLASWRLNGDTPDVREFSCEESMKRCPLELLGIDRFVNENSASSLAAIQANNE